jgi:TctA family transporter
VLEAYVDSLQFFLSAESWLYILGGIIIGLIFGALPGIGAIVTMSLMLPFIFLMRPEHALPLFIASSVGAVMGGSITSILLNVPGTTINVATLLDGYPMTQKGEGARALGAALTASAAGGAIPVFLALAMIPMVLTLALALRSGDMVFVVLLGLCFLAVVSRGSMLRGLIAGAIGILFSLIGIHYVTGITRFTFGSYYLLDGLPLVPVTLGLFAMPEMLRLAVRGGTIAQTEKVMLNLRGALEGAKDVVRHWWLWLRCTIIGYIIGIIPGVGASIAIWVAYGHAKQTSKHPETFGTGNVEGVIAPESANNAKEAGALLPTLALGIPGSGEMVIVLLAIMLLGIRPGPEMMTVHLPLSLHIIQVVFVANVLTAVICFLLAPRLAKVATIPVPYLVPIVMVIVFVGAFAYKEDFLNLIVLLAFTLLGLLMRKYDFNRPALLLGIVLGGLFEKYVFIGVETGGPLFFVTPISLSLIIVILTLFLYSPIKKLISRRSATGAKAR